MKKATQIASCTLNYHRGASGMPAQATSKKDHVKENTSCRINDDFCLWFQCGGSACVMACGARLRRQFFGCRQRTVSRLGEIQARRLNGLAAGRADREH